METLKCIHNALTATIFLLFVLICVLVNKCCLIYSSDDSRKECTCEEIEITGEITPSNNIIVKKPGQPTVKLPLYNYLLNQAGEPSPSCIRCTKQQLEVIHSPQSSSESEESNLTSESDEYIKHTVQVKVRLSDSESQEQIQEEDIKPSTASPRRRQRDGEDYRRTHSPNDDGDDDDDDNDDDGDIHHTIKVMQENNDGSHSTTIYTNINIPLDDSHNRPLISSTKSSLRPEDTKSYEDNSSRRTISSIESRSATRFFDSDRSRVEPREERKRSRLGKTSNDSSRGSESDHVRPTTAPSKIISYPDTERGNLVSEKGTSSRRYSDDTKEARKTSFRDERRVSEGASLIRKLEDVRRSYNNTNQSGASHTDDRKIKPSQSFGDDSGAKLSPPQDEVEYSKLLNTNTRRSSPFNPSSTGATSPWEVKEEKPSTAKNRNSRSQEVDKDLIDTIVISNWLEKLTESITDSKRPSVEDDTKEKRQPRLSGQFNDTSKENPPISPIEYKNSALEPSAYRRKTSLDEDKLPEITVLPYPHTERGNLVSEKGTSSRRYSDGTEVPRRISFGDEGSASQYASVISKLEDVRRSYNNTNQSEASHTDDRKIKTSQLFGDDSGAIPSSPQDEVEYSKLLNTNTRRSSPFNPSSTGATSPWEVKEETPSIAKNRNSRSQEVDNDLIDTKVISNGREKLTEPTNDSKRPSVEDDTEEKRQSLFSGRFNDTSVEKPPISPIDNKNSALESSEYRRKTSLDEVKLPEITVLPYPDTERVSEKGTFSRRYGDDTESAGRISFVDEESVFTGVSVISILGDVKRSYDNTNQSEALHTNDRKIKPLQSFVDDSGTKPSPPQDEVEYSKILNTNTRRSSPFNRSSTGATSPWEVNEETPSTDKNRKFRSQEVERDSIESKLFCKWQEKLHKPTNDSNRPSVEDDTKEKQQPRLSGQFNDTSVEKPPISLIDNKSSALEPSEYRRKTSRDEDKIPEIAVLSYPNTERGNLVSEKGTSSRYGDDTEVASRKSFENEGSVSQGASLLSMLENVKRSFNNANQSGASHTDDRKIIPSQSFGDDSGAKPSSPQDEVGYSKLLNTNTPSTAKHRNSRLQEVDKDLIDTKFVSNLREKLTASINDSKKPSVEDDTKEKRQSRFSGWLNDISVEKPPISPIDNKNSALKLSKSQRKTSPDKDKKPEIAARIDDNKNHTKNRRTSPSTRSAAGGTLTSKEKQQKPTGAEKVGSESQEQRDNELNVKVMSKWQEKRIVHPTDDQTPSSSKRNKDMLPRMTDKQAEDNIKKTSSIPTTPASKTVDQSPNTNPVIYRRADETDKLLHNKFKGRGRKYFGEDRITTHLLPGKCDVSCTGGIKQGSSFDIKRYDGRPYERKSSIGRSYHNEFLSALKDLESSSRESNDQVLPSQLRYKQLPDCCIYQPEKLEKIDRVSKDATIQENKLSKLKADEQYLQELRSQLRASSKILDCCIYHPKENSKPVESSSNITDPTIIDRSPVFNVPPKSEATFFEKDETRKLYDKIRAEVSKESNVLSEEELIPDRPSTRQLFIQDYKKFETNPEESYFRKSEEPILIYNKDTRKYEVTSKYKIPSSNDEESCKKYCDRMRIPTCCPVDQRSHCVKEEDIGRFFSDDNVVTSNHSGVVSRKRARRPISDVSNDKDLKTHYIPSKKVKHDANNQDNYDDEIETLYEQRSGNKNKPFMIPCNCSLKAQDRDIILDDEENEPIHRHCSMLAKKYVSTEEGNTPDDEDISDPRKVKSHPYKGKTVRDSQNLVGNKGSQSPYVTGYSSKRIKNENSAGSYGSGYAASNSSDGSWRPTSQRDSDGDFSSPQVKLTTDRSRKTKPDDDDDTNIGLYKIQHSSENISSQTISDEPRTATISSGAPFPTEETYEIPKKRDEEITRLYKKYGSPTDIARLEKLNKKTDSTNREKFDEDESGPSAKIRVKSKSVESIITDDNTQEKKRKSKESVDKSARRSLSVRSIVSQYSDKSLKKKVSTQNVISVDIHYSKDDVKPKDLSGEDKLKQSKKSKLPVPVKGKKKNHPRNSKGRTSHHTENTPDMLQDYDGQNHLDPNKSKYNTISLHNLPLSSKKELDKLESQQGTDAKLNDSSKSVLSENNEKGTSDKKQYYSNFTDEICDGDDDKFVKRRQRGYDDENISSKKRKVDISGKEGGLYEIQHSSTSISSQTISAEPRTATISSGAPFPTEETFETPKKRDEEITRLYKRYRSSTDIVHLEKLNKKTDSTNKEKLDEEESGPSVKILVKSFSVESIFTDNSTQEKKRKSKESFDKSARRAISVRSIVSQYSDKSLKEKVSTQNVISIEIHYSKDDVKPKGLSGEDKLKQSKKSKIPVPVKGKKKNHPRNSKERTSHHTENTLDMLQDYDGQNHLDPNKSKYNTISLHNLPLSSKKELDKLESQQGTDAKLNDSLKSVLSENIKKGMSDKEQCDSNFTDEICDGDDDKFVKNRQRGYNEENMSSKKRKVDISSKKGAVEPSDNSNIANGEDEDNKLLSGKSDIMKHPNDNEFNGKNNISSAVKDDATLEEISNDSNKDSSISSSVIKDNLVYPNLSGMFQGNSSKRFVSEETIPSEELDKRDESPDISSIPSNDENFERRSKEKHDVKPSKKEFKNGWGENLKALLKKISNIIYIKDYISNKTENPGTSKDKTSEEIEENSSRSENSIPKESISLDKKESDAKAEKSGIINENKKEVEKAEKPSDVKSKLSMSLSKQDVYTEKSNKLTANEILSERKKKQKDATKPTDVKSNYSISSHTNDKPKDDYIPSERKIEEKGTNKTGTVSSEKSFPTMKKEFEKKTTSPTIQDITNKYLGEKQEEKTGNIPVELLPKKSIPHKEHYSQQSFSNKDKLKPENVAKGSILVHRESGKDEIKDHDSKKRTLSGNKDKTNILPEVLPKKLISKEENYSKDEMQNGSTSSKTYSSTNTSITMGHYEYPYLSGMVQANDSILLEETVPSVQTLRKDVSYNLPPDIYSIISNEEGSGRRRKGKRGEKPSKKDVEKRESRNLNDLLGEMIILKKSIASNIKDYIEKKTENPGTSKDKTSAEISPDKVKTVISKESIPLDKKEVDSKAGKSGIFNDKINTPKKDNISSDIKKEGKEAKGKRGKKPEDILSKETIPINNKSSSLKPETVLSKGTILHQECNKDSIKDHESDKPENRVYLYPQSKEKCSSHELRKDMKSRPYYTPVAPYILIPTDSEEDANIIFYLTENPTDQRKFETDNNLSDSDEESLTFLDDCCPKECCKKGKESLLVESADSLIKCRCKMKGEKKGPCFCPKQKDSEQFRKKKGITTNKMETRIEEPGISSLHSVVSSNEKTDKKQKKKYSNERPKKQQEPSAKEYNFDEECIALSEGIISLDEDHKEIIKTVLGKSLETDTKSIHKKRIYDEKSIILSEKEGISGKLRPTDSKKISHKESNLAFPKDEFFEKLLKKKNNLFDKEVHENQNKVTPKIPETQKDINAEKPSTSVQDVIVPLDEELKRNEKKKLPETPRKKNLPVYQKETRFEESRTAFPETGTVHNTFSKEHETRVLKDLQLIMSIEKDDENQELMVIVPKITERSTDTEADDVVKKEIYEERRNIKHKMAKQNTIVTPKAIVTDNSTDTEIDDVMPKVTVESYSGTDMEINDVIQQYITEKRSMTEDIKGKDSVIVTKLDTVEKSTNIEIDEFIDKYRIKNDTKGKQPTRIVPKPPEIISSYTFTNSIPSSITGFDHIRRPIYKSEEDDENISPKLYIPTDDTESRNDDLVFAKFYPNCNESELSIYSVESIKPSYMQCDENLDQERKDVRVPCDKNDKFHPQKDSKPSISHYKEPYKTADENFDKERKKATVPREKIKKNDPQDKKSEPSVRSYGKSIQSHYTLYKSADENLNEEKKRAKVPRDKITKFDTDSNGSEPSICYYGQSIQAHYIPYISADEDLDESKRKDKVPRYRLTKFDPQVDESEPSASYYGESIQSYYTPFIISDENIDEAREKAKNSRNKIAKFDLQGEESEPSTSFTGESILPYYTPYIPGEVNLDEEQNNAEETCAKNFKYYPREDDLKPSISRPREPEYIPVDEDRNNAKQRDLTEERRRAEVPFFKNEEFYLQKDYSEPSFTRFRKSYIFADKYLDAENTNSEGILSLYTILTNSDFVEERRLAPCNKTTKFYAQDYDLDSPYFPTMQDRRRSEVPSIEKDKFCLQNNDFESSAFHSRRRFQHYDTLYTRIFTTADFSEERSCCIEIFQPYSIYYISAEEVIEDVIAKAEFVCNQMVEIDPEGNLPESYAYRSRETIQPHVESSIFTDGEEIKASPSNKITNILPKGNESEFVPSIRDQNKNVEKGKQSFVIGKDGKIRKEIKDCCTCKEKGHSDSKTLEDADEDLNSGTKNTENSPDENVIYSERDKTEPSTTGSREIIQPYYTSHILSKENQGFVIEKDEEVIKCSCRKNGEEKYSCICKKKLYPISDSKTHKSADENRSNEIRKAEISLEENVTMPEDYKSVPSTSRTREDFQPYYTHYIPTDKNLDKEKREAEILRDRQSKFDSQWDEIKPSISLREDLCSNYTPYSPVDEDLNVKRTAKDSRDEKESFFPQDYEKIPTSSRSYYMLFISELHGVASSYEDIVKLPYGRNKQEDIYPEVGECVSSMLGQMKEVENGQQGFIIGKYGEVIKCTCSSKGPQNDPCICWKKQQSIPDNTTCQNEIHCTENLTNEMETEQFSNNNLTDYEKLKNYQKERYAEPDSTSLQPNRSLDGSRNYNITGEASIEDNADRIRRRLIRIRSNNCDSNVETCKVSSKITITSRGGANIEELTNSIPNKPLLRISIIKPQQPVNEDPVNSTSRPTASERSTDSSKMPNESIREYLVRSRNNNITPSTTNETSSSQSPSGPSSESHSTTSPNDREFISSHVSEIVAKYHKYLDANTGKLCSTDCLETIEQTKSNKYVSDEPSTSGRLDYVNFYPGRNHQPNKRQVSQPCSKPTNHSTSSSSSDRLCNTVSPPKKHDPS